MNIWGYKKHYREIKSLLAEAQREGLTAKIRSLSLALHDCGEKIRELKRIKEKEVKEKR